MQVRLIIIEGSHSIIHFYFKRKFTVLKWVETIMHFLVWTAVSKKNYKVQFTFHIKQGYRQMWCPTIMFITSILSTYMNDVLLLFLLQYMAACKVLRHELNLNRATLTSAWMQMPLKYHNSAATHFDCVLQLFKTLLVATIHDLLQSSFWSYFKTPPHHWQYYSWPCIYGKRYKLGRV